MGVRGRELKEGEERMKKEKKPWDMTLDEFTDNIPVMPLSKTEAFVMLEGRRFRFNVPLHVENIIEYARERVIKWALNNQGKRK